MSQFIRNNKILINTDVEQLELRKQFQVLIKKIDVLEKRITSLEANIKLQD